MLKKEKNKPQSFVFTDEAKIDTSDISSFEDCSSKNNSFEEVFSKHYSQNLTVRLSPELLNQLRREAERMGVGSSTLARMWILEHLRTIRNEIHLTSNVR